MYVGFWLPVIFLNTPFTYIIFLSAEHRTLAGKWHHGPLQRLARADEGVQLLPGPVLHHRGRQSVHQQYREEQEEEEEFFP